MKNTEFILWKTFSYVWTEIGVDQQEFLLCIQEIQQNDIPWKDVSKIIYKDILWGFSPFSLLLLVLFIPFVGIFVVGAILPEWEFEDIRLQKTISNFNQRRRLYWVNPFLWIGYIISFFMCLSLINQLKRNLSTK